MSLNQALTLRPELTKTRKLIADIELSRNRFLEAISHLQQLLKMEYELPQTLSSLGSIFFMKSDRVAARENFQRALEVDPFYSEALYGMGALSAVEKQFPEAKYYFEKALVREGESLKVIVQLARVTAQLGERAESVEFWRKAISLTKRQSGDPRSLFRYTSDSIEQESLKRALELEAIR